MTQIPSSMNRNIVKLDAKNPSDVNSSSSIETDKKPSSPRKMQREVEKGQAPKDVDRVDKAHNPEQGGKPHVHYKDGTASNNDGTIHDKGNGIPNPVNKVIEWLKKHNWVPPAPPPPTKKT